MTETFFVGLACLYFYGYLTIFHDNVMRTLRYVYEVELPLTKFVGLCIAIGQIVYPVSIVLLFAVSLVSGVLGRMNGELNKIFNSKE